MKITNEDYCPLLKKPCIGLKCAWFTKVTGYDMNSGTEVDEWKCAVTWLPVLLIETSGQVRQGAAATESFRNEMVQLSTKSITQLKDIYELNEQQLLTSSEKRNDNKDIRLIGE